MSHIPGVSSVLDRPAAEPSDEELVNQLKEARALLQEAARLAHFHQKDLERRIQHYLAS